MHHSAGLKTTTSSTQHGGNHDDTGARALPSLSSAVETTCPPIDVCPQAAAEEEPKERQARKHRRRSRPHSKLVLHDPTAAVRDPADEEQASPHQVERRFNDLSLSAYEDGSDPPSVSVRRHSEPVCRPYCHTRAPEKKQRLYKTELCRNWRELDHCRYGDKCQYAHGLDDLRQVERHPKYKTQTCRTFQKTGNCPYGTRCTFRHQGRHDLQDDSDAHDDMQAQRIRAASPATSEDEDLNCKTTRKRAVSLSSHCLASVPPPTTADTPPSDEDVLPREPESLLPHTLLYDLANPPLMSLPCFATTPKDVSRSKTRPIPFMP